MADRPPVYLCVGGDCRTDHPTAHRKLRAALDDAGARVVPVRCQKVCKGPVVGVQLEGELEWLRRIDRKKWRRALVRALARGRLPDGLRRRRVKKRRGKLRE